MTDLWVVECTGRWEMESIRDGVVWAQEATGWEIAWSPWFLIVVNIDRDEGHNRISPCILWGRSVGMHWEGTKRQRALLCCELKNNKPLSANAGMWSLNKWFHRKMCFLTCGSVARGISRQHGFNPYHNKCVLNIYTVLGLGEDEKKGKQSSLGNMCPSLQLCLLPSRWQEETWQFQTFCGSLGFQEAQLLLCLWDIPLVHFS